ncbi:hypothetical protein GN316_08575 [Xylophilus sp. Kf1]|nr:hypothetical protein [Xylophilus sp. Kf1]
MSAEYLVNLGIAQLYFDADGKRCAPPGSRPDQAVQTVHFVQVAEDGALLTKTWDIGLAEFSAQQREKAKLYKKSSN